MGGLGRWNWRGDIGEGGQPGLRSRRFWEWIVREGFGVCFWLWNGLGFMTLDDARLYLGMKIDISTPECLLKTFQR